jgi:hypothetical protein
MVPVVSNAQVCHEPTASADTPLRGVLSLDDVRTSLGDATLSSAVGAVSPATTPLPT